MGTSVEGHAIENVSLHRFLRPPCWVSGQGSLAGGEALPFSLNDTPDPSVCSGKRRLRLSFLRTTPARKPQHEWLLANPGTGHWDAADGSTQAGIHLSMFAIDAGRALVSGPCGWFLTMADPPTRLRDTGAWQFFRRVIRGRAFGWIWILFMGSSGGLAADAIRRTTSAHARGVNHPGQG